MSATLDRWNWLARHGAATGWILVYEVQDHDSRCKFTCSHPTHDASTDECNAPAFMSEVEHGRMTGRALCWDHREFYSAPRHSP